MHARPDKEALPIKLLIKCPDAAPKKEPGAVVLAVIQNEERKKARMIAQPGPCR
jgi:hypothetical protein